MLKIISRRLMSVILMAVLVSAFSMGGIAQPAYAQSNSIAAALLVLPEGCVSGSPCLWSFQPGTRTVAEFQQFAATVYGIPAPTDVEDKFVVGAVKDGIALHAATSAIPAQANTPISYLYLRIVPKEVAAAPAPLDYTAVTPASIVARFGAPSQAYLLFSPSKKRTFSLLLLYPTQQLVYVINGNFSSSKACIKPQHVETYTLYRFSSSADADQFLRDAGSGGQALPASITETTRNTLADFVTQGANLCLTPK